MSLDISQISKQEKNELVARSDSISVKANKQQLR
jgi:hypothetical protein